MERIRAPGGGGLLARASGELERETSSVFSKSICRETSKKLKGTPLETKPFEKRLNAIKTERGDPSVSPGIVCYAEKKEQNLSSGLCAKWSNYAY